MDENQQLENACKNKSKSQGGLNIPEFKLQLIKEYLNIGIDKRDEIMNFKGVRHELEIKYCQNLLLEKQKHSQASSVSKEKGKRKGKGTFWINPNINAPAPARVQISPARVQVPASLETHVSYNPIDTIPVEISHKIYDHMPLYDIMLLLQNPLNKYHYTLVTEYLNKFKYIKNIINLFNLKYINVYISLNIYCPQITEELFNDTIPMYEQIKNVLLIYINNVHKLQNPSDIYFSKDYYYNFNFNNDRDAWAIADAENIFCMDKKTYLYIFYFNENSDYFIYKHNTFRTIEADYQEGIDMNAIMKKYKYKCFEFTSKEDYDEDPDMFANVVHSRKVDMIKYKIKNTRYVKYLGY